jgi:hypothetical protein
MARSDELKVIIRDHNGNTLASHTLAVDGYRVFQPVDWFMTDDRSTLVCTLSIMDEERWHSEP